MHTYFLTKFFNGNFFLKRLMARENKIIIPSPSVSMGFVAYCLVMFPFFMYVSIIFPVLVC